MKDDKDLKYMASIYMALADKTRLRLLDMMRDGEICVGSLTDTLGESQPKISRHLAYLRNAGIVDARRDGKWIHYSIRWPDDAGGRGLIRAALEWVSGDGNLVKSESKQRADIPFSAARGVTSEARNDLIYAEPDVIDSNIYGDQYDAHNELDDFLL